MHAVSINALDSRRLDQVSAHHGKSFRFLRAPAMSVSPSPISIWECAVSLLGPP